MTRSEYKAKSETAQGRYNLHGELLSEIKTKMDGLMELAPKANQDKVAALFDKAFNKLESEGNSILFDFFDDDVISTKEFARNIDRINRGTL